MRYLRFTIQNYRAINGPLTIDVSKRSLLPIIGVNESGKTTILHAIAAFDRFNDDEHEGHHLRDVSSLYRVRSPSPTVTAEIEVSRLELQARLAELAQKHEAHRSALLRLRKSRALPTRLSLVRNLETKNYSVATKPFAGMPIEDLLVRELIMYLPYVLFFDDFRDKVDEQIEIVPEEQATGWLEMLQQLFLQTDPDFSVYDLAEMEERKRKSVLAKVKKHLNRTLTAEWQNFRLDEREALQLHLDFHTDKAPDGAIKKYLKLNVVEIDASGEEHYFHVSDRSKGFYWFFNFVMKLEFNPKYVSSDDGDVLNTIYLLDEPGSYLHASAQSKLCSKLRTLSERNRVIYCTHSHYLLNPDVVPLSAIHVAEKDANGNVRLLPIYEHKGSILDRRSAFQPVLDALQIKPFILDLTTANVVITEGIQDYYALEIFKGGRQLAVMPSVGAQSIKFYMSLMVAWQVAFRALWDNDETGRQEFGDAKRLFGDEIADRTCRLLPLAEGRRNRILQDLFEGQDLRRIKEQLALPVDTSFDKTITAWFYSSDRAGLLRNVSPGTRDNFERVFAGLGF